MDLGPIRKQGNSMTGRAWITNPTRSILWRLALPYFQGIGHEIDRLEAEVAERLRTEAAQIEGRLKTELAAQQAAAMSSKLGGVQKDLMAVAHRLSGLEEEAEAAAQARDGLARQAGNAAAEARQSATSMSSFSQQIGEWIQKLGQRIDALADGPSARAVAEAHEAMASVLSLRHEVISLIQALNERIDTLARGPFFRAGGSIALGREDLVVAPYVGGTHFLVRQRDLIGGQVANGGEWEPHVRAVIERAALPEGVAVDAGAYIGLHTVAMSRCFGTVHAFEPQRDIFHVLCGNLALNGCTNVVTHNLALYDHAGPMRLAPPERQEIPLPLREGKPDYSRISNAAALTFEPVGNEAGEVHAIPLDELALEKVTLVKVDTQGADLRVLQGAADTIRRCRPTVLFEWEHDLSSQHGTTLEEYHAFFAALDYDVSVLHETSPGRQVDYLATPR
jgi:FkbM family methyltransferase